MEIGFKVIGWMKWQKEHGKKIAVLSVLPEASVVSVFRKIEPTPKLKMRNEELPMPNSLIA
jgi:hypothetical protein